MNRKIVGRVCAVALTGVMVSALIPLTGFSQRASEGRFIVTLASGVAPETVARDHGVNPSHVYRAALNGFAGSIPELARAGLMRDARVQAIEPDSIVTGDTVQEGATEGLDRIDQRSFPLNQTYTYASDGTGVTVYIVDSGIRYTHVEFGGRATFGFDALGGDGSDCHGHGTHVAGIAGGATYGVAKNVALVSVRVIDCNNSGTISGIIAGVDWVTANHAPLAVANLSLGAGASVALDTAVQNMMFSGVVTAIAAGNTNNDACLRSPARVTNAMTVGSTDPRNDNRAPTSSFGPCVDWFAPGYGITSAWNGSDTDTRLTGGTSMASPHTAGVAALYLQNHPGASQIEARDALLAFSTKGVVVYANSVNSHLLYNAETPDGFGDFTSPTASITFPADGALVQRNKNITIQAAASDSGGPPDPNGVAMVEFFVGGALICTDTTAPYTCAWKVPPSPPNAVYRLQSRVFDTAGNGYASTFVTVQAK